MKMSKLPMIFRLWVPVSTVRTKRSGFTLLELMFVISVMAILAALLFPAFSNVRDGAREKQAQLETKIIGSAIAAYKLQTRGRLPAPDSDLRGGNDLSYGEGQSGGDNREVMNKLIDEAEVQSPVLDVNKLRWDDQGNVLNPWGNQYKISLDLDYDGSPDVYKVETGSRD